MTDSQAPTPAIVLVDDDFDFLLLMHRVLQTTRHDCEIVSAWSGAEVLERLGRGPVPLVITDYNMLGMNGLDLTTAIKARSPSTQVILITAYATPELEKAARAHQVDYYLPKPFSLDHLEEIVRAVIPRAQA